MYDPNNYSDVEPYQTGDEPLDDIFDGPFEKGSAFDEFMEWLQEQSGDKAASGDLSDYCTFA